MGIAIQERLAPEGDGLVLFVKGVVGLDGLLFQRQDLPVGLKPLRSVLAFFPRGRGRKAGGQKLEEQ